MSRMLRRSFALTASFLLLLLASACAPSGFCDDVVDRAKDLANNMPGGPPIGDVTQSPAKKGAYAATYPNNGPVKLFPQQIASSPSGRYGNLDMCNDFAVGVVAVILYHERLHKCLEMLGSAPTADCNKKDSCTHLAIDLKVRDEACDKIADLKLQQPPPLDVIAGMCAAICELCDKWNNPNGAARAKECFEGTGPCPLPAGADSTCGIHTPQPTGPGNTFPNNIVIPPCPECPQC